MKFNIYINQYKLSEYPEITIQDCAVIDWLYSMFGSSSDKINNKRIEGWTWISLIHLIDDMPLLRLKTSSGASKMVNRIKNMGFIETKVDRKERKLFARPTKKIRDLYFSSQVPQARSQVLEETSQVPQDLNHNTNIIILNPTSEASPPPPKEKPFFFEEEMQKLLESKYIPDRVRWLYFTKKEFRFENLAQWKQAMSRNLRPAQALNGYNSDQVEQAITYCQENYNNIPWTLETILKIIPNVVNKK